MQLQSLLLSLLCINNIKAILKEKVGYPWLFFLVVSVLKANRLFKQTKWGHKKDEESAFVKTIILIPAFYLYFKKKYEPEQALGIMQEIVHKVSFTFDYNTSKRNLLFVIRDPFERWLKYRSTLIASGFGAFNEIEDVYISKERMHYVVRRCIFHDYFAATGTPELTRLICDYDRTYHDSIFKEFYFDRNGSWKNTIGHGADVCHYVWKDRKTLSRNFINSLENENDVKNQDERRKTERRQSERRQGDRRQYDRRNAGKREVE